MSDALRLLDHPLSSALGWSLVHFVWQGALIGLAAFMLLRGVRPAQSQTRYAIGVGALLVMFLAPVVTFMAGAGAPRALALSGDIVSPRTTSSAGLVTGSIFADATDNPAAARQFLWSAGAGANSESADLAPVWLPIVTVGWMLGVVALSLRLLGGWLLTRSLARRAVAAVSRSSSPPP